MILATQEDIQYPHVDWKCSECGCVYVSSGRPDPSRCYSGHDARWKPAEEQMKEYIDILESLEVGDGVLFAGHGPAPLMGPVKRTGTNHVITESISSPSRKIRWGDNTIEQANLEREHLFYDPVYHVDKVEVLVDGD